MRSLALYFFIFTFLSCQVSLGEGLMPHEKIVSNDGSVMYIYHLPDDSKDVQVLKEELSDIISDDVTADTSEKSDYFDESDNYLLDDMYGDVLKGYVEYDVETEEGIELQNPQKFGLNLKKPEKINNESYTALKTGNYLFTKNKYSKYNMPEYSVAPISKTNSRKFGNFSAGTSYNQGLDYGELEQTSGVFSRYEYKNFAIQTSYAKTVNSTNNNYNDNFYISPEFKLNQYFVLKNNWSADITKHRKKAELVLSINPFGNRDYDRMRIEFGASQTYDDTNELFKSQFRFATNFKL